MEAMTTTHEELLTAIVGGLALVIVAVIPILVAIRRGRTEMSELRDHLPPNGARLWERVEATNETVTAIQIQVAKVEVRLDELAGDVDELRRRKGGTA